MVLVETHLDLTHHCPNRQTVGDGWGWLKTHENIEACGLKAWQKKGMYKGGLNMTWWGEEAGGHCVLNTVTQTTSPRGIGFLVYLLTVVETSTQGQIQRKTR